MDGAKVLLLLGPIYYRYNLKESIHKVYKSHQQQTKEKDKSNYKF